jgi:hypothetical protein
MKLSNKILIGFFGFIFLYLTAAFAELRISGTPNVVDDKNSTPQIVDISGVTHLILKDLDRQVNVIGSDRSQLEVRSISGDLLAKLKYKVSGDTLTISGLQSEGVKTMKISVFIPEKGLRGITVKSSVAIVKGLHPDVLNISQTSGTILISESAIGKIQMDLNQAFFEMSGTNVDTVSVNLERSQVSFYSPVGLMKGVMKDEAYLRLHDVQGIQLKKDESSRVNVFQ